MNKKTKKKKKTKGRGVFSYTKPMSDTIGELIVEKLYLNKDYYSDEDIGKPDSKNNNLKITIDGKEIK